MRMASRRRRCRGDSGVSALEFAIVVPILLLLVIGIMEFAFVIRDQLSVAAAARTGVRTASTEASAGPGTCPGLPVICVPTSVPALAQDAVDAIQQSGSAMPQEYVDYVLVYSANAKGFPQGISGDEVRSTMPSTAECATMGECVVFTWDRAARRFKYTSGTWDSSTIYACAPTSANPAGPDSVGVYMSATHPFLSRLFGATLTIASRSVLVFEPLPINQCAVGKHQ